jgi:hypothetical protein
MVGMRIRPTLTGKDADRFITRMRNNELNMKQHAAKQIERYKLFNDNLGGKNKFLTMDSKSGDQQTSINKL